SIQGDGRVGSRIRQETKYTRKTTADVIGVVRGKREPMKKVNVGGHYDSQRAGPLLWDNGTGVAAVLEMSRVLSGKHPLRTVVFIAFSAEEIGLLVASAYARQHAEDLAKNAVGMITLDALS